MKEIGYDLFDYLWQGLKNVWKSISNWVGDKVDWILSKLKVWEKAQDKMGGGGSGGSSSGGRVGSNWTGTDNWRGGLNVGRRKRARVDGFAARH